MHIDVCDNAGDDLRQLRVTDPPAAAAILTALQQVEADPRIVDKLTTHGNNEFGALSLNVKAWEKVKRYGNLWRFRVLDTAATSYRVVYGYHYQTRQICILAVVHKEDFDYDDTESDICQRIIADWRLLF